MASINALFATSEYRGLDELERAVKLVEDKHTSASEAARICGVSRAAVRRGIEAHKKGRDIGLTGRPRLLSPAEEKQLVNVLEEADQKKQPIKFEQFQDVVCYYILFSVTVFLEYFHYKVTY